MKMRSLSRLLVVTLALSVLTAPFAAFANDTVDEQTYPFASQDNISILIFGNSWTHPAAGSFANLALTINKHVRLMGLRISGASYERHVELLNTVGAYEMARWNTTSTPWQIADADLESKTAAQLIAGESWDIIILNNVSSSALEPWTAASKSAFDTLVNYIHTTSPATKIYINQTWAYGAYYTGFSVGGVPNIDNREAMYEQSVANNDEAFHRYDDDANLGGVIEKICPSGYAFQLYLYRRPIRTWSEQREIQGEDDQGRHPNNGGYQLEALTWLRTIFGALPTYAQLPDSYKTNFSKFGTDANLALSCAEDATKAAHSRYLDYGRGTVDFSYTVRFLNYDRSVISEQSVSNLLCAVMPDMTTVDVGEGYELDGWRTEIPACNGVDDPYLDKSHVYTPAQVAAYRIFDTTDFVLKRRLVGDAGVERVWTGNVDNDWSKAGNWDPEAVPNADSEVTIPYSAAENTTNLVVAGGPISVSSLTVGSGDGLGKAYLQFNHKLTNEVASVQVNARGKITSGANGSSGSAPYRVVIHTTGNFTIAEGGSVDVSAKGYSIGYGVNYSNMKKYAGSHGGIGAGHDTTGSVLLEPIYSCYGSIRAPVTMGSGGDGNNARRAGGGVVHLIVDGTLTVNGDILAVGGADDINANRASSAGGSVWLEAGMFLGSGSVDVRGGRSNNYVAGGSGRIAVITKASNAEVFSTVSSAGTEGVGTLRLVAGPRNCNNNDRKCTGCGTVYIESAAHPAGGGDLYIDGCGTDSSSEFYGAHIGSLVTEANDADVIFNSINVKNKGRLYMEPGSSLRTYALNIANSGGTDTQTTCAYSANDPTLGTIEIVGAHHWGAWVTNPPPTCVATGLAIRACTDDDCDAAETNVLAALGHDWVAWVTNTPPQIGVAGERTRTCQRSGCGAEEKEVVPALDDPTPTTYTLTLNECENGSIAADPATGPYEENTEVTLTPTPNAGYHFVGWTDDATGTVNPLTITMNANKTIGATFEADSPTPPPGPVPGPTMDEGDGYVINTIPGEMVLVYTNVNKQHTFTVPTGVSSIRYLVVAGGGSGGARCGGGGGAGGMLTNNAYGVSSGTTLLINVGAGGAAPLSKAKTGAAGSSGGDSSITNGAAEVALAYGGGGGGGDVNSAAGTALPGGSGGGGNGIYLGRMVNPAGQPIDPLQGNAGGSTAATGSYRSGGGGGGAGACGGNGGSGSGATGGVGGAGLQCDITGEDLWYAAGGGGAGVGSSGPGGAGGSDGVGGTGGKYNKSIGTDGMDGRGGGGGGGGQYTIDTDELANPGKGGDGVVIIRYAIGVTPQVPSGLMIYIR